MYVAALGGLGASGHGVLASDAWMFGCLELGNAWAEPSL